MYIHMIWPEDKFVSARKVCAMANDAMIDENEKDGTPIPEMFREETAREAAAYLDDIGRATFRGDFVEDF